MSKLALARLFARAEKIPGLPAKLAAVLEHMVVESERADRSYASFHWGRQATKVALQRAPMVSAGEVLVQLGELSQVAYTARKGGDDSLYEWVHSFSSPMPVLASTKRGQLVVLGGRYRITSRGIVG